MRLCGILRKCGKMRGAKMLHKVQKPRKKCRFRIKMGEIHENHAGKCGENKGEMWGSAIKEKNARDCWQMRTAESPPPPSPLRRRWKEGGWVSFPGHSNGGSAPTPCPGGGGGGLGPGSPFRALLPQGGGWFQGGGGGGGDLLYGSTNDRLKIRDLRAH